MQIGFLVDKIAFGGGERILKMLIDEFCKRGHVISIYSWNKEWLSFNNIHNYNIYVLPGEPIGVKGKIIAYRNLRRQMLLTRPDCLIIFSLGLAEIGVFVAKTVCVPTILSERVDPKYLPQSKIHRLLKLLVYHFCDGIVFQTVQVKQYFSKSIQKKSIEIQNPIMDDNLPVANDNSAEKEIVAVGRLSIEKNYKLLIRAFAELNIPEYRLKIFGKGPLFNELSDLIDSLRMNDKIILEGSVDRVVDFIRNSDIFVLSSNHEGMPNALIEAMAMGLACISTDFSSGGARALITNNENGIIVPVDDLFSLKNAILNVVFNTDLKQKIKANAVKIRETNSKERILPIWIEYINTILQKKE